MDGTVQLTVVLLSVEGFEPLIIGGSLSCNEMCSK